MFLALLKILTVSLLTMNVAYSASEPLAGSVKIALSAEASLGREIFHDESLSASGRMSCATCHDAAHAFVHAVNHRGVGGIVVSARWRFGFELRDQVRLRLVRRVNAEMWQVEKERPILVTPNEILRFAREKIREVLPFRIFHFWIRNEIKVSAGTLNCFIEPA